MRIFAFLLFISLSCFVNAKELNSKSISQLSTYRFLSKGLLNTDQTIESLGGNGEVGFGFSSALRSVLFYIDDAWYEINESKGIDLAKKRTKVIFATLIARPKSQVVSQKDKSFEDLTFELEKHISDEMHPLAFIIDGDFSNLELRLPKAKKKPYPKNVNPFKGGKLTKLGKSKGTVVGFWFPDELSHVNKKGFSMAFISEDKSVGGLVDSFKIENAKVKTVSAENLDLMFPNSKRTRD